MQCYLVFFYCIFSVIFLGPHPICARDTITRRTPLADYANQTLVSAGKTFELGFFTPQGSSRYVGIWYYNRFPRRIVWVANREKPLSDSSGLFCIAEDGKLKLLPNETGSPVAEFGDDGGFNRTVKLLDNGNLVLSEEYSILWQSFDNPTDTFLPGMKMDDKMALTSWLNPTDPSRGSYTFRREQGTYRIQNGSNLYWTGGELGLSMIVPDKLLQDVADLLSGFSREYEREYQSSVNQKPSKSISFNFTENSSYSLFGIFMNSTGEIQYYRRDDKGAGWVVIWSEPRDHCCVYNACGKFNICNINTNPRCKCLPGFQSDPTDDLSNGDCVRRVKIRSFRCDKSKFLNVSLTYFEGTFQPFDKAKNSNDCKRECLSNCKCKAYYSLPAIPTRRGSSNDDPLCYIGTGDLSNLRLEDGEGDFRLHVRVTDGLSTGISPNSSSKQRSSNSLSRPVKQAITISAVIAAVLLVCCFSYIIYRRTWMTKGKATGEDTGENPGLWTSQSSNTLVPDSIDEDNKSGIGVPFYSWESILAATENFSDVHKLGRGGFGPVYKGTFSGGREIAIKRLSSYSVQGINEFRNEVVLISKLQHRNLVRLLGYCIKDNEKILLYEFMPNKSLDAFIFDKELCMLLNWKKRLGIILGIARGVLYLHQDSRLRIIHRDLKTSNILLDEEMNPKISDFGLARIVEGKQTESCTKKVVGTYGYMSPEYALDGVFSIKSDVFSFGVVVLEIISGKKSMGVYQSTQGLNLLSYAWGLWSENKALGLMDPMLLETYEKSEVLKCINVGLLCVQEDPSDRPTMANVVFMLGGQATTLPVPNQPAFVTRKRAFSTSSSSSITKPDICNDLTMSEVEGR